MADKKRAMDSSLAAPGIKATEHLSKRLRIENVPVKLSVPLLADAEMELLRALEEDIAREEEKGEKNKKRSLPVEDDDYDESDDE